MTTAMFFLLTIPLPPFDARHLQLRRRGQLQGGV
jgi:hypothetical protein